ncbi:MAG: phenylalanine--tRNA ligase subunit beta [Chloroflexota bacterium]|nr:phenylalanine--tRNA ligase subunit beta [Chloroflexota bacterium]
MKAPLSWLKDYVKITLPPTDLAHRLTMAGTEVSSIETVGGWEHIVVGQVVAIEPHPGADRLKLAIVDVGGERFTSVCGAPNVDVGQKVPFAHIGAQFLDPDSGALIKLKKTRIRGVESQGMVCSERELGISDRHEGILVLPDDAPLNVPLDEYLGDAILDMDVTPNRPDCLSVIGIAWEAGALTGQAVSVPDVRYDEAGGPAEQAASVEIIDPDLCPRYCATLLTNVTIGPSPLWMQQRLLACGMRPISNIVDVTNYVMLEYGQPLHAFDFDKLAQRRIMVRRARPGERLTTIDDIDRPLTPDMLVICDGEGPVAVAGIMGGSASEVTEGTTSILLESANFNAASLRRTSARLKLRSEASLRFEKGLSPELPMPAVRRATQLMARFSGATVAGGVIDAYPGKKNSERVSLTARRVEKVLGIPIEMDRIGKVLSDLGFDPQPAGANEYSVAVPYWRTDIRLADDLVEEVARIVGYDEIPTTLPSGALPEYHPDPMRQLREQVSDILVGCGMQEAITYSLTSLEALGGALPGSSIAPLKVANRITAEQEYLRTSLRPWLLQALSANEKHEEDGVRLFEVAKVYLPRDDDLPREVQMLAGVLCGPRLDRSWHGDAGQVDFFDAKGIVETLLARLGVAADFELAEQEAFSPGRAAAILAQGSRLGALGELHPRVAEAFEISSQPVCLFEIDLETLLPMTTTSRKYQPVARYPATIRDIALVVDRELPAAAVQSIIEGSPLAAQVTLFDVYTGDRVPAGRKSLAFRIAYQSPGRTLTDEQVNKEQEKLLKRLQREAGATLRA